MPSEQNLACPVCKARFRSACQCPRCHADLTRLMTVVGYAYHLRMQARASLYQGQYHNACRLAQRAQDLHDTPRGRRLLYVATMADSIRVDANP